MDGQFQQVDVSSGKITVKAMFGVLLLRRSILSASRFVDKRFAFVMGNESDNQICKNGSEVHLHKSSGVYHVRASALSELCVLEDQDPSNDAGLPAEAVREAAAPWTRRFPYKTH